MTSRMLDETLFAPVDRPAGRPQRDAEPAAEPPRQVRLRHVPVGQLAHLGATLRRRVRARAARRHARHRVPLGRLHRQALRRSARGGEPRLDRGLDGRRRASPVNILLGYWPQVRPSFWSITLFRWDINIRESAILGLVGAGGIGVALDTALNLLYWDQVAVVLLTIFAVVIATEVVVTSVRSRII